MVLKVGIVGVGKRGTQFVDSLIGLSLCKVSYICDKNEDKLRIIKDKYGYIDNSIYYKDIKSYVDAVIIATPVQTHFEIASFFLKSKIPVLLEKPSTLRIEETEELFKIARDNNTHIQIGYTERYSPPLQEVKNILLSRRSVSGKDTKLFIEASRCNEFSERVIGIDVILDLMIHDIDIIINIIKKEPFNFYGFTSAVYDSNYDFAKVMFEFDNNVFAECTANRISASPQRTTTIYMSDTIYRMDFLHQSLTIFQKKGETISCAGDSELNKYIDVQTRKGEFRNLIVEQFKEFINFIKMPSMYDHSMDILTLKTANKVKEKLSLQRLRR